MLGICKPHICPNYPEEKEEVGQDSAEIRVIEAQFKSIQLGNAEFHERYLQERQFIKFWQKSLQMVTQVHSDRVGQCGRYGH